MDCRYSYEGPVTEFNRVIASHWSSSTVASSEKKALCNFKYQFKKQFGKSPSAKIELPGKIKRIE